MRKYFLLSAMAVASLGALVSCERNDVIQQEVIQTEEVRVRDATGTFGASNNYALDMDIEVPNSYIVLVYRNTQSNTSESAIWQLLPKTYYLNGNNRELEYNFIFNRNRIQITTEVNFDPNTLTTEEINQYIRNQTFRMVIIPASVAKGTQIDYSDYNKVIKHYRLNDSNVTNKNL